MASATLARAGDFGLIRNTDFEELLIRYRQEEELRTGVITAAESSDVVIRKIMAAFELACTAGKVAYATLSLSEFKVLHKEIKERARRDLKQLEKSLSIVPSFLRFIARWLFDKKMSEYQFTMTNGYSQDLISRCINLNNAGATYQAVAKRAYEIYNNRKRLHGDAVADWLKAEMELRVENCQKIAVTYYSSKLPVNFEELMEQIWLTNATPSVLS